MWKRDEKNGNGTFYFKSGDRYEGQWNHGKETGTGTIFYSNGTTETKNYD